MRITKTRTVKLIIAPTVLKKYATIFFFVDTKRGAFPICSFMKNCPTNAQPIITPLTMLSKYSLIIE
jgi:hypothetical protein